MRRSKTLSKEAVVALVKDAAKRYAENVELKAKCERYQQTLIAIGNGCATPQRKANEALSGEGEKEVEVPPQGPDYGICQRCKQERATTRYSNLYVCEHCDKMLNNEFDEEYR